MAGNQHLHYMDIHIPVGMTGSERIDLGGAVPVSLEWPDNDTGFGAVAFEDDYSELDGYGKTISGSDGSYLIANSSAEQVGYAHRVVLEPAKFAGIGPFHLVLLVDGTDIWTLAASAEADDADLVLRLGYRPVE